MTSTNFRPYCAINRGKSKLFEYPCNDCPEQSCMWKFRILSDLKIFVEFSLLELVQRKLHWIHDLRSLTKNLHRFRGLNHRKQTLTSVGQKKSQHVTILPSHECVGKTICAVTGEESQEWICHLDKRFYFADIQAYMHSLMRPVAPHIDSFLDALDPTVDRWISHLDYTSRYRKCVVFMPVLILRSLMLIGLLWRFTTSLFWRYPDLCFNVFSIFHVEQNNTKETSAYYIWQIINFSVDYILFKKFFVSVLR